MTLDLRFPDFLFMVAGKMDSLVAEDEIREAFTVFDVVRINKHCEILVSCSDKERNSIHSHETACRLM